MVVSRVFLVDRHADHPRNLRIADLHHRVVVNLRIKTEKRGNGEVLALFVETVAGVAAGVVFVLDVGSCVAIADVESDIAVIASELMISNAGESTSLFLKVEKAIENPWNTSSIPNIFPYKSGRF